MSLRIRAQQVLAPIVLALAAVAFTTPTVVAAENAAAVDAESSKLVLVLDSSGSMSEPASGGESKISAAKAALNTVITSLPADQEVGLRVYGAKVFSQGEPGACTDSQLVVPLASDNRAALRSEVAKYKPFGETPIGYALQEAGKDLGESGRRNIVLVSDGVPTCDPDPCEVARELSKQGIDLRIDVVGLDVDDNARKALECIANAGNGTYYDATNRGELSDSLIAVARRSARPYAPTGQVVAGAPDPASAPVITAGEWLDTTESPTADTYYRIERGLAESTILASAAYRAGAGVAGVDNVNVYLQSEDGATCDINNGVAADGGLVSAAAAVTPYGQDAECLTSPSLILRVEYLGNAPQTPTEIKVSELPAVTDLDSLPEPSASTVEWIEPTASKPRTEATGGISFSDAEALEPGSYRGTIVPGELLTFTVNAEWGQQVAAAAHFLVLRGGNAAVANGTQTNLEIFSPSRVKANAVFTSPETSSVASLLADGSTRLQATTGVVNFANLSKADASASSESGAYTVILRVNRTEGTPSIAVPFELDLATSGTANAGPTFAEEVPEPTASATDSADPSPSDSATPTPSDDEGSATSGSQDEGGLPLASLAVGGLGVAALAGALLLALKRRSGSHTA